MANFENRINTHTIQPTKFAADSKFDSTHTRTVGVHERHGGGEEDEEEEEDLFVFNLNDTTVRGYRGKLEL